MGYNPSFEKKMSDAWLEVDRRQKAGLMDDETANRMKERYHASAERERAKAGYSGGVDGSQIIIKDRNKLSQSFDRVAKTKPSNVVEETKRILSSSRSNTSSYQPTGGREVVGHQIDKNVPPGDYKKSFNDSFDQAVKDIKDGNLDGGTGKMIMYGLGAFILIGLLGN